MEYGQGQRLPTGRRARDMEVQGRQGVLQELDIPPAGRRRIRDWLKFGLVGASGLIVNQILVVALTELAGFYYVISAVLATFGSSTWNFFGADSWAFADRRGNPPRRRGYPAFLVVNPPFLVAPGALLWWVTAGVGRHYSFSHPASLILRVGVWPICAGVLAL